MKLILNTLRLHDTFYLILLLNHPFLSILSAKNQHLIKVIQFQLNCDYFHQLLLLIHQ